MRCVLFFAGVPAPACTDAAVAELFGSCGEVLGVRTERARGYGFVRMADEHGCAACIAALHHTAALGARRMIVERVGRRIHASVPPIPDGPRPIELSPVSPLLLP